MVEREGREEEEERRKGEEKIRRAGRNRGGTETRRIDVWRLNM
jgi:hypothetical protein